MRVAWRAPTVGRLLMMFAQVCPPSSPRCRAVAPISCMAPLRPPWPTAAHLAGWRLGCRRDREWSSSNVSDETRVMWICRSGRLADKYRVHGGTVRAALADRDRLRRRHETGCGRSRPLQASLTLSRGGHVGWRTQASTHRRVTARLKGSRSPGQGGGSPRRPLRGQGRLRSTR